MKKILIISALIILAVVIGIIVIPKLATAPERSGTELNTKYISGQEWPPKITNSSGSFSCREGGSEIMLGGVTTKKTINGRVYCITIASEGAAGSIYTTYTYTTAGNGKLITAKFILRYPQCLNYSDPQKTECLTERQTFDLDGLLDKIVTSSKF